MSSRLGMDPDWPSALSPALSGLADPEPLGLAVTGAYLVAFISVLAATFGPQPNRHRAVWLCLAVVLALLLGNQQSDLHNTAIPAVGRLAGHAGIYPTPAEIIAGAVVVGAVSGLVLVTLLALTIRRRYPPGGLAGVGVLALVFFVVARFASLFHPVWAGTDGHGPAWLRTVEIVGLGLVAVGSFRRARRGSQPTEESIASRSPVSRST